MVDVVLYAGELQSRPLAQVLNGANTALMQAPDGAWEVFQFLEAEEIGLNHWRLQRLLRGQLGTERAALVEKPQGTPFILLDAAVRAAGLTGSELGLELNWRAGTAGKAFSEAFFDTRSAIGGLRALKPLSPVHLKYELQPNGALVFHWIRRGRVDADSWLGEDIPLGEERELYRVEVWQKGQLLHSDQVASPVWTYAGAERLAEAGIGSFALHVAMVGAKTGPGDVAILEITKDA